MGNKLPIFVYYWKPSAVHDQVETAIALSTVKIVILCLDENVLLLPINFISTV